jgi:hypothetical protein
MKDLFPVKGGHLDTKAAIALAAGLEVQFTGDAVTIQQTMLEAAKPRLLVDSSSPGV